MSTTRREWLRHSLGTAAAAPLGSLGLSLTACSAESATFPHGVASGDPLPDAVILWTRVSSLSVERAEVLWVVAKDPDLLDVVAAGTAEATVEADYTVKVDATGLDPGTTYYYGFEAEGGVSLVGRTRTAGVGTIERLRVGVASCSNYAQGFFHAYRHLAEQADLDFVVHLGDYIYETGVGEYAEVRQVDPPREIVTLDGYRRRYQHHRADPDLQAAHQQHPFICVWDDHEFANDAWTDGAANHDDSEGDFATRRAIAMQVYGEYMPVRAQPGGGIWRGFAFGDLMDLMMLDTRIDGRSMQLVRGEVGDPSRQILGAEQRAWLSHQLQSSGARWKVLGQQVMLGQLRATPSTLVPFSTDQWDGYPEARRALHDLVDAIDDVVVLTGDTHSSWATDIVRDPGDGNDPDRVATYDPISREGALAVEFVTTSITSPTGFEGASAESFARSLLAANPHVKHVDLAHRGFTLLDLTAERIQADFVALDGVAAEQGEIVRIDSWEVRAGRAAVLSVDSPVSPRPDAPALAPGAPARALTPVVVE